MVAQARNRGLEVGWRDADLSRVIRPWNGRSVRVADDTDGGRGRLLERFGANGSKAHCHDHNRQKWRTALVGGTR